MSTRLCSGALINLKAVLMVIAESIKTEKRIVALLQANQQPPSP